MTRAALDLAPFAAAERLLTALILLCAAFAVALLLRAVADWLETRRPQSAKPLDLTALGENPETAPWRKK